MPSYIKYKYVTQVVQVKFFLCSYYSCYKYKLDLARLAGISFDTSHGNCIWIPQTVGLPEEKLMLIV